MVRRQRNSRYNSSEVTQWVEGKVRMLIRSSKPTFPEIRRPPLVGKNGTVQSRNLHVFDTDRLESCEAWVQGSAAMEKYFFGMRAIVISWKT